MSQQNYINKFITLTKNILDKKESNRFLKTVQNLKIVELDVENSIIYIKGAVPGFNGSDLKIKPALKRSWK